VTATGQLPPIARRIKAAVQKAFERKLEPRSLYLTPPDRDELLAALKAAGTWWEGEPEPDEVAGLSLRRVSGRGRSRVYCRHGIAVALPVQAPP
jgi:hypothetical protein